MVLSNELPTMLQLMGHFLASVIAWRGRELARLQAARRSRLGGADGIRFRADHLVRCGEIWQDAQPGVTVNWLSIPSNPFASRLLRWIISPVSRLYL